MKLVAEQEVSSSNKKTQRAAPSLRGNLATEDAISGERGAPRRRKERRYSFDKNGNENFDKVKQKELQQCGYLAETKRKGCTALTKMVKMKFSTM